ncbi:NAD(P)/FAD-dependent oxidoreductase [Rhodococcus sp. IEGM 1241]|uniref:flavin-containing monooxygenase n=1 Tax=Rhodococcus TaxID=1827 RepID=UPI0029542D0B|nr:NAD(P)/FAD-dependent oxidoreductase [Rhodococcus sp. IEGM 1241]MDJ0105181.1 NAD(P)/FAD-dependent oxidoreductase [Rhodococcus erythropolis]MDV8013870.1 NAD(P)/FAD-dependent oxidoreductase [Rhodococcus sp. IEGM 1241]
MTTRITDPPQAQRFTLDSDSARRAVAAADLRALLMMVFHHTGDRYWLSPRFRPVNDVRLIAPEDAGLEDDVQQELRDMALQILSGSAEPVLTSPDDELLTEMMSVAIGRRVPAEYATMIREQIGFESPLTGIPDPTGSERATVSPDGLLPVLVVGAGESGIAISAMLADIGIDHLVIERQSGVGGTWRSTAYPGCGVDTPNHSYSYSFGPRYPWPRFFSARSEIQEYLETCADEFAVRERIQFNTSFVSATWQQDTSTWRVLVDHDGNQQTIEARYLVTAIGPFGAPQTPNIAGVSKFDGPIFHAAQWPEDLDVSGKSVAIVGTGASCMQIAPTIADQVSELTVLQRTPQWIRPIPRFHELINEDAQALLTQERYYSSWYRFIMIWRYGDGLLPTLRKDPDWPHPERSLNRINDRHREEMTEHIHEQLSGREDLIDKCVPDYPPYGKRILLDNGWYKMLTKPQVRLETGAIEQIESGGIRLHSGELVSADVIVLATGYDVSKNAAQLDIIGRENTTLAEAWTRGTGAHLGVTVPGFPNMFILQGPTTGLGHGGSAFFTSEVQSRYAVALMAEALVRDLATIEVKPAPFERYLARVDAEHENLVWTHPGMNPYYRNAFGSIRTVMPWRLVDYFQMMHRPDLDDFETTSNESNLSPASM